MNGGITVFLSLILTCVCALLGGLFESVRVAGSGWYVQMALDSSLDSLMSCYHRDVWEMYRLFVLECADKGRLEEEMEPYCRAYLDAAPFYPLEQEMVTIKSAVPITDGGGAYFEQEVLDYMKVGIWNIEEDPSVLTELAADCREAESFHNIAELYQENGRKVLRLEEAIEQIGECLERQENCLQAGNRALERADGSAFFREADKLKKELRRIPGLVEEYRLQADRLEKELAQSEDSAGQEREKLKAGSWGMLQEEMESYRSYTSKEGERRREVEQTETTAGENERIVDLAVAKAEEIQEYIDSWEPEDEDDELDEEALWAEVLRITGRFQKDGRFRKPEVQDKEKMNVLESLSRLAGTDLLALCVPEGTVLSEASVNAEYFPSVLCQGAQSSQSAEENLLQKGLERALLDEYAGHFFTNFRSEEERVFCYEQEYLLQGETSDRENLKRTVNQLIAVREAFNLMALFADGQKREEARALALAITGAAGLSPLSAVLTFFIMTVWAFAESVEDVRMLLAGGKIPFVKAAEEWRISLTSLSQSGAAVWGQAAGKEGGSSERGLDYDGWLKVFFLIEPKAPFCYRMMDMIQKNISGKQPGFSMADCLFRLEAEFMAEGTLVPVRRSVQKEY